jgi:hypothetical protein
METADASRTVPSRTVPRIGEQGPRGAPASPRPRPAVPWVAGHYLSSAARNGSGSNEPSLSAQQCDQLMHSLWTDILKFSARAWSSPARRAGFVAADLFWRAPGRGAIRRLHRVFARQLPDRQRMWPLPQHASSSTGGGSWQQHRKYARRNTIKRASPDESPNQASRAS